MVFGAKAKFNKPAGLDGALQKLIVADLKPLDRVKKGWGDRAARYVIDGDDADVLLELAASDKAAAELGLVSHDYNYVVKFAKKIDGIAASRLEMFEHLSLGPGAVFVRLGELYAACQQGASGGSLQRGFPTGGWPNWLLAGLIELVFAHSVSARSDRAPNKQQKGTPTRFSLAWLEDALAAGGAPPETCLVTALTSSEYRVFPLYVIGAYVDPFELFSGWKEYAGRHEAAIRNTILGAKADEKVQAIKRLLRIEYDFTPILDLLITLATGTAKTVRETATQALGKHAAVARASIETVLKHGSASERNEAAALLWRLGGNAQEVADLLKAHAEDEKSSRVAQTIERLIAAPITADEIAASVDVDLPPLDLPTLPLVLPESARRGLADFLQENHRQLVDRYEQAMVAWNDKTKRPRWMTKPRPPKAVEKGQLAAVLDFIEGRTDSIEPIELEASSHGRSFGEWLTPPDVRLEHVVRLMIVLGKLSLGTTRSEFWCFDLRDLEAYRERCGRSFGLREFDAAVARLPKGRAGLVASAYLENSAWRSFCDWESEGVWPAFYEQIELLLPYFGPSLNASDVSYQDRDFLWEARRTNAFRVLAKFPQLPSAFIRPLWDLALGESKTLRPLAQEALRAIPDKAEKVIVALADGKQAVRGAAAEWLGVLGDPAAIEPLRKAFKKEKQEFVKGQMITALEALGHDITEYFNRAQLARDAEKGLVKKLPKGAEWIPLNSLPELHWDKTGKRVAPEIVKWWVVQSVRFMTPTPGPLLRRYLEMCRRDETRALAKYLLQLWVTADTRALPYDEAAERAKQESDQLWSQYGGSGGWFDQHYGTKDNLYRERLQNYLEACVDSAIGEKGMLAVVAAGGDADCAKIAEQYIRKWYGQRAAQCKALLEMLSWIEDPMAIQVLLSIASRFRTKSIRKAAEDLVNVLAERQGWTIDQLADRTLPDAGFARETDKNGEPVGHEAVLLLDYGPRRFRVTLDDALAPVIAREDGTKVKSLPTPGKNDDEQLAKSAKKEFSKAKRTLQEIVKRQSERLYESLCTQRSWRAEEWRRYLADHAVVGRLCSRVVWVAFDGPDDDAQPFGSFRLLEDGSLTDYEDNEFDLPDDAIVGLAHTCNTSAEVGSAWLQHLDDYDVAPLFPQFGRAVYELPEGRTNDADLEDFRGHCLTTFQLRGKATKLGFVRGEAEDGGAFFVYRKSFPALALEAVLEFTGSYLPEEDLPAALTVLYFVRTRKDGSAEHFSWQPAKVPLGKVPPVLLSECRNDVAQIAAAGTGFDPEWQKKSYF